MNRYFWKTAVALVALLFSVAACNGSSDEADSLEINGPAFILFYTDN